MTSDRQKTVTCYSFARSRCPGPSTLVSSDYQAAAGSRRYALQGHLMYAKRPLTGGQDSSSPAAQNGATTTRCRA
jgi:hypothetical protein